ncbi:MAG TPA: N-acetylmuramoyl-L-alanine amidase, partial [Chthoniobacterales bacterium]|nr:N-acetylmuramoyl-L-alanine amidase [Chthoniobacterales bacterium]
LQAGGRRQSETREHFVSIHFDDAQEAATGAGTYYAANQISNRPGLVSWLPFLQRPSVELNTLEREALAAMVEEALVGRTKAMNRGMRAEKFYVIANVRHPAILVEGGFLTNKDDAGKLGQAAYREQLAVGIADGIKRYREVIPRRSRPPRRARPKPE